MKQILDEITFDLSSYNATNEATHTWKAQLVLTEDIAVKVAKVPPEIGFFLVQVHTHLHNVSMLFNNSRIKGTNIGVVQMANGVLDTYSFLIDMVRTNISALVVITAYDSEAPIPGGCNMTFALETAPYQVVTNTGEMVRVDSQAASQPNHICEGNKVKLEMYHLYLEEWNFEEDEYFKGIEKMISVRDIEKNGRRVPDNYKMSPLRRYYNAYVGTGAVYAIIARYGNFNAAYIPAVSYACEPSSCYSYGKSILLISSITTELHSNYQGNRKDFGFLPVTFW